jgi:stage III sporulation protein AH
MKRKTMFMLLLFSLAAVISVYYIFDAPESLNVATFFSDEALDETIVTSGSKEDTTTDQYLFEEIRLEIANERSQIREQLTEKIASDAFSAEEKNSAYNEMNELIALESNESTLEMLVKGLGYSDALVRLEQGKATVTVMSEEMTKEQANEIIYLVKNEVDDIVNVSVNVQSSYY